MCLDSCMNECLIFNILNGDFLFLFSGTDDPVLRKWLRQTEYFYYSQSYILQKENKLLLFTICGFMFF